MSKPYGVLWELQNGYTREAWFSSLEQRNRYFTARTKSKANQFVKKIGSGHGSGTSN